MLNVLGALMDNFFKAAPYLVLIAVTRSVPNVTNKHC